MQSLFRRQIYCPQGCPPVCTVFFSAELFTGKYFSLGVFLDSCRHTLESEEPETGFYKSRRRILKFGMRRPGLKKSLRARTTGKVKRAVRKAVVPGYGKKGMAGLKTPKKLCIIKYIRRPVSACLTCSDKRKRCTHGKINLSADL